MRKTLVASMILLSFNLCMAASERRDADIERIQTASTVLNQIMSAPDRAIPDEIMSGAKCIAIMPSMLKASFIFGANYGKGVASCRTGTGWSSPAFFKLTGGSFGFQAGGQASDLVLIIRTDDGMQHLLQSKFKLGADASAAAGPVGRDAQAMTDLTLRAQVLTYSRSRGLFLGVSLSGGVINQDQADTQAFYGRDWTFYSLLNGEVPAPKEAESFLQTVEKYAPTPRPKAAPSTASLAPPAVGAEPMTAPATQPAPAAAATAASAESPVLESDSAATPASVAQGAPVAASTSTAQPATAAPAAASSTIPATPTAAPATTPTSQATPATTSTPAATPVVAGTPGGR